MSKTDKTQPYWVKLAQNPDDRKEFHNHQRGICDIDNFNPKRNNYFTYRLNHCYYKLRKVNEYWIFNGRPHVKHYRPYHVRAERAQLRNKIHNWLKMNFEDIYDDEFGNYQHRHSALWEAW